MATSKSKVAAAKKLASKIKGKAKGKAKPKDPTERYRKQGQNAPQSKAWTEPNDEGVAAKPVGWRYTKLGAKRLNVNETDKPSQEHIAKYKNKTFMVKGEANRYLYTERRVDKSDKYRSKKFEEGGTLGAGSFKRGGATSVSGRQRPNYREDIDGEKTAKPAGWRFTDKLARKLNKSLFAKPTLEEIKKYSGRGVYYERRQDKSDAKPSKKYISLKQGGEMVGGDIQGAGMFARGGINAQKKALKQLEKDISWRFINTDMGSGWHFTLEQDGDVVIEQKYLDIFDAEGIDDWDSLSKADKKYYYEEWKEDLWQASYPDFLEKAKKAHLSYYMEQGGELNGSNITGAGMFKRGGATPVSGRQYDPYREDIDGQKMAKPAGWRFTDRLAKRLGKSSAARPTAAEIEKYRNRGVYFEQRQDKSDAKPSKKYISLEQGGEMVGGDIQGAGMFARGGATRVTNAESRTYTENMLPFMANNLEGKTLANGDYVVLSYGYYPIWYYSKKESKWYGNKDKYSVSTAKHISQSRPTYDATILSKSELMDKMMGNNASFENGGVLDGILSDAPNAPTSTIGGTTMSTGDLTPHMDLTNPAF